MYRKLISVRYLVFSIVIGVILVGAVILTYQNLTSLYPGHNDFMSRWEGARSFWVDGLNPYGEEASFNIQDRIFGRPAIEGEDPGYFAYPFYTVLLLLPVVFTSYAWATAIWMVIFEACLVISLFLILDILGWKPKSWLLGLLVLWTLVFYSSARGLILGQLAILVYFLEILTIWALLRNQNEVAGVALAISTIKPQMGFLIVPFLLLWGLRVRRWRFLSSFSSAMAVLVLMSFVLMPSWLTDWVQQVGNYTSYTALASPVWIITNYYLGLPDYFEWIVNAAFIGLMLWTWYQVLLQGHQERWLWICVITLTVTNLVAPRTATPHYVVFILPLMFYFAELSRRDRKWGSLWVSLMLVGLTVLPWVHFLLTVEGEFEQPATYLPLPFSIMTLLWLTRKLWFTHSPLIASTKTAAPAAII